MMMMIDIHLASSMMDLIDLLDLHQDLRISTARSAAAGKRGKRHL